jgi:hypothetical protein
VLPLFTCSSFVVRNYVNTCVVVHSIACTSPLGNGRCDRRNKFFSIWHEGYQGEQISSDVVFFTAYDRCASVRLVRNRRSSPHPHRVPSLQCLDVRSLAVTRSNPSTLIRYRTLICVLLRRIQSLMLLQDCFNIICDPIKSKRAYLCTRSGLLRPHAVVAQSARRRPQRVMDAERGPTRML